MRLQAIKLGKVFLIEKPVWEHIENLMLEFEDYYDSNLIFGGLLISDWGVHKQFCKIRAIRRQ
jgi:hypothetical protein